MCLAIPQKVIKIKGHKALVQSDKHTHQVSLALLKNVKVGDFIIATNELAINKISKGQAQKIIKLVNAQRK